MKIRPLQRYWYDEYLPKWTGLPLGSSANLSRLEVIDKAKTYFGDNFAAQFDQQKKDGIHEMSRERFWASVKRNTLQAVEQQTQELPPICAQEGKDTIEVLPNIASMRLDETQDLIEHGYVTKGIKTIVTLPNLIPLEAPWIRLSGTEHNLLELNASDTLRMSDIIAMREAYTSGRFDEAEGLLMRYWKDIGRWQKKVDQVKSGLKLKEHREKEELARESERVKEEEQKSTIVKEEQKPMTIRGGQDLQGAEQERKFEKWDLERVEEKQETKERHKREWTVGEED